MHMGQILHCPYPAGLAALVVRTLIFRSKTARLQFRYRTQTMYTCDTQGAAKTAQ